MTRFLFSPDESFLADGDAVISDLASFFTAQWTHFQPFTADPWSSILASQEEVEAQASLISPALAKRKFQGNDHI